MPEDQILDRAALQLQQHWGVQTLSRRDLEGLRLALVVHLEWMIVNELERLVQAMYRLDLPEKLFHEAMKLPTLRLRAESLADAVLAREFQRAETWLKYSSPRKDSND